MKHLGRQLQSRLPPLAVQVRARRVRPQVAPVRAVRVHARDAEDVRASPHPPRHGILVVEKPPDEALHPPARHGLARVLPRDDPHAPLRPALALPRGQIERRVQSLHRRGVLLARARESRLGDPTIFFVGRRRSVAEAKAVDRAPVQGRAEVHELDARGARGAGDEVVVLLLGVRDEVGQVDGVAGDRVEANHQLAVDVRRVGLAAPTHAVRGDERLVAVPPVGIGRVARVLDDHLQRAPPRARDAEVEPLEVPPAVLLRERLLGHAHRQHVRGRGDELAVAAVEGAAEAVRRRVGGCARGAERGGGGHDAEAGETTRARREEGSEPARGAARRGGGARRAAEREARGERARAGARGGRRGGAQESRGATEHGSPRATTHGCGGGGVDQVSSRSR